MKTLLILTKALSYQKPTAKFKASVSIWYMISIYKTDKLHLNIENRRVLMMTGNSFYAVIYMVKVKLMRIGMSITAE